MEFLWLLNRVGGVETDDFRIGTMALTIGTYGNPERGMRRPLLAGKVVTDFNDGESYVRQITSNSIDIAGDDAITILLAAHANVEGCDEGEWAACPSDRNEWLGRFFDPTQTNQLARKLTAVAFGHQGASDAQQND